MFDEIDVTMDNDGDLITRAEAVKAAVDWNVPSHEDVFDAIKCVIAVRMHAVPKVGGWISIKDRMPEPNKDVLLSVHCERDDDYYLVIAWQTASGDWDSNDEVFLQYDDEVTHWMPLPEPPEVSENG